MSAPEWCLATACGGLAAFALSMAASWLPRQRLATRRALVLAGVVSATLVPVAALAASSAGLGFRETAGTRASPETTIPPATWRQAAPDVARPPAPLSPPAAPPAPAAPTPSPGEAACVASPTAPSWDAILALVWAAGTALGLGWIANGLVRAARLRRGLAPLDDPRAPGTFVSDGLAVPATVGVLRPVVALPRGIAARLSDADLGAVLRHERSHAMRRDPLWGLVARVARAMHWPNPLAHLAARRLDSLSESLADASAVEPEPAAAPRYAACLVTLAEAATARRAIAGVHSIVGRRGALSSRVEALLDAKRRPDARPCRLGPVPAAFVALAGLASVALVLPRPLPAAADDGPAAAPEKRAGLAYSGRVLDPDGKPVEGAVVWADAGSSFQVMLDDGLVPWKRLVPDPLAAANTWHAVRAARTAGADGRFVVEGVGPAAGGSVLAYHPRWATAVAAVPATAATVDGRVEVGDLVLRRAVSFSVWIRDAKDAPVAGAWLAAQPEERSPVSERVWPWSLGRAPGFARVARADERGIAVLEGLEPGARYAVAAFTDRHPPHEAAVELKDDGARVPGTGGWGLAKRPDGVFGPAVTLAEGTALRVVAVDRVTGAPRPGCRVDLAIPEEGNVVSFPRPGPIARMSTGPDGVAEFVGLNTREYEVTVVPSDQAAVEHSEPPPFSVRTNAKAGGDPVKVALDPVRSVRVEAFDAAAGTAVSDVRLLFSPVWQGYDQTGGFPGDVSVPRRGLDAFGSREGVDRGLVSGLRPGKWTLRAYAPGFRPATVDVFTVPSTGDPPLVRVPLDKASASAFGRVVAWRTGAPVAGATVRSYEWLDWLYDGPKAEATSGADGTFRFDGLIGAGVPLRLDVSAPGYLAAVVNREDRSKDDIGDVALVKAATIRGTYVDGHTKAPIPHAKVDLWRGEGRSSLKADFGASTTTDDAGRFVLEGITSGRWTLIPAGGRPLTLDVEEGAALDVTLSDGKW